MARIECTTCEQAKVVNVGLIFDPVEKYMEQVLKDAGKLTPMNVARATSVILLECPECGPKYAAQLTANPTDTPADHIPPPQQAPTVPPTT